MSLKLFVAQMTSVDDLDSNLRQILATLDRVGPRRGLTLVSFPENCLYLRLREGESIPALELSHPAFARIAEKARALSVNVHLGSVPLRTGGKPANATVFISANGEIISAYEKIHLFDIQLENGPRHMESDAFAHGRGAAVIELREPAGAVVDSNPASGDAVWRIGLTICYDLRFSPLFHEYALAECDLILVPAAFLVPTGQAHWEVLLRARAIETQAYVAAAAQAGVHQNDKGGRRETFGHSLIIDPWGRVLTAGGATSTELLEADLLLEAPRKVRAQIPMKSHRRGFAELRTFKVETRGS